MFNFKKPLAFITGIICSTICFHHCSALKRNGLGIITELTKDATVEKKIEEACLAYKEYAERLNARPAIMKKLYNSCQTGTVVSLDLNNMDINTDYYNAIVKGNFGLKWVAMHYIARLLNEAGVRADLWCFYNGMFKPSASARCEDILNLLYHCLVVYDPNSEILHTFDFNVRAYDLEARRALDTPKLNDEPVGQEVTSVYTNLINAFKQEGIQDITMTCTNPINREFKPLPPEIKRAGNYARALAGQPNVSATLYENVYYVSESNTLKAL